MKLIRNVVPPLAIFLSLLACAGMARLLWAQGQSGTLVGIPFATALPLDCSPSQPGARNPVFYLTQASGLNNVGVNYCIANKLWAAPAVTVARGTAALGTSSIASGACATTVTASAAGVLTSDNILADFSADPTATTGYAPGAGGILTVIKFPTANQVNFDVCNNTTGSITPGAVTLNWRVLR